jgi:hypothetical protein
MTSIQELSTLNLSVDELGALAQIMGAARFPGVPDDAAPGTPTQVREAALTAARRGLVARGLVVFSPEGTPALEASCADLVTIPLTAELVVAAERRDRVNTFVRHYYVRPDAGVEHGVVFGSIHQLARFPSEELLSKVVDFAQLEARNGASGGEFTTRAGAFQLVRSGMAGGDLAEAREALGPDGAAFADAIGDFVGSARVRILRHEAGGMGGGEVLWVDAGGSLWHIETEPVDPDTAVEEQKVRVAPCSALEIVDEILGYLPSGSG